jgi:hypothetical protein
MKMPTAPSNSKDSEWTGDLVRGRRYDMILTIYLFLLGITHTP